jgi:NitT/TauT family transport system ATP-binding protein
MITLDAIRKTYRSGATTHAAIGNVSLTIEDGEFVSIVGPSGCGKSTLLNLIAGFIAPSAGDIRVKGQLVEPGRIPARLGYLFQKDAVLPWLTVEQNVGLGLRFAHMPAAQIREKVAGLLRLANLQGYENYFPYQLSGGMRQRTALLMTLACDPRVLLLDEPFGALSDRVIVLSGPPSRILLDRRIDIPHPRDPYTVRETEGFGAHLRALWSVLGKEYQRTPDGTAAVLESAA